MKVRKPLHIGTVNETRASVQTHKAKGTEAINTLLFSSEW